VATLVIARSVTVAGHLWYVALLQLLPRPPSALDPTHRGFVFDGYGTSSIPGEVPINACAGT